MLPRNISESVLEPINLQDLAIILIITCVMYIFLSSNLPVLSFSFSRDKVQAAHAQYWQAKVEHRRWTKILVEGNAW